MKVRWIYFYLIIVICLFSDFATAEFETEIVDEKKCSSNLFQYEITTSYGPKLICAYISPERKTWDEAKFRCNLLFAELAQRIQFESSLHSDLLKKGIDILWIGIRRRNNFFVTEYPSKLFREADSFSSGYWGYYWSDDEPGSGDCVAMNVSSGSLHTRKCSDLLPFVCDDDGKDISTIYENFACPEGWNLSFALSLTDRTCISLQKPRMYEDAEENCAVNDGRLATFQEYNILYTSNYFSSLEYEIFWMKKRTSYKCEVRFINNNFNEVSPRFCRSNFPSICVKNYESARIRVSLTPKSMKPMQSDSRNLADLLTCDLETQFSGLSKKIELLYEWYKDGLPLYLNSDVIRLSFIGDGLKRDPYISDIASRQGYYYCEVQYPGSNKKYFSQKMKYFYTDIATYVVEIRGIKPRNDLDYSHQRFFDYMNDFDEASMSNVLKKVKVSYPDAEWDFISKSILDGEAVMKIVVYIYKTGIKDFDERIACEELKEAFEELHSIPVFIENMSVRINCEEFPITNANIQIIKKLKNIEVKINHMESRQEYILEKMGSCENSRNIKPTGNSADADPAVFLEAIEDLKGLGNELFHKIPDVKVALFLEAVEDLKNLGNSLLHITPDFKNLDGEHDHRERNEFEDNFFSLPGKKFLGKSKKLNTQKDIASESKRRGFIEERNQNYIQHSEQDWEEIVSRRNEFLKDL